jgi:phenylalanyl-tRNA synthetase beta chain
MNISYLWLRSLAPTITGSPAELADRLALLGAPVDEVLDLGAEIRDVVIARVEAVRPHPNADRLRVCTVAAGGAEPLQVVCGAPNVEAGGYYPFVPVGASLPGGLEIRKAKLRGEVSEGMLCSARELGLGRDHAGLLALHGEWEIGGSFIDQLGLADSRLVVDVTANRPDLLCHLGVARELAPGGVDDIVLPPFGDAPVAAGMERERSSGTVAGVQVRIEDADGCPRYLAAVIRGVRIGPSPEWLATRLRSVGLRPINNVVDATNFVLHEVGQPLHAFDVGRLSGPEVRVRAASGGERLRTLDGLERVLDDGALVIADADRPIAMAGVMGGEESEVGEDTSDLLLECALFDPGRVRRAARSLSLSTDASYRFERGVDPELQPLAMQRLIELVLVVAGGELAAPVLDLCPEQPRRARIPVRVERVRRLLGVPLESGEIRDLLAPIGLRVRGENGALTTEVPGYRPDITREVDVIEEIARRRGYDSFPEQLQPFRPSAIPEDPLVRLVARARQTLSARGFMEARASGFAPSAEGRVPLLNPLSADESHLRDSLVPGLLRRIEHNWARGSRDVRLFEVGTVFFPSAGDGVPNEQIRIAAAFTGAREPIHWSGSSGAFDLWDLKGLAADLATRLGAGAPRPPSAPSGLGILDPNERLELGSDRGVIGEAGRVSATMVDAPAWADPVFIFEMVLHPPAGRAPLLYRAIPEFPAVERDLALVVSEGTTSGDVEGVIRRAAGTLLEDLLVFDLYVGKGIAEGARSVAWRLRFRDPQRTLTDREVDRVIDRVLQALKDELDVVRR